MASEHGFALILDALDSAFLEHRGSATAATLPFVTLAYAQSLDGSLAGETGKPLRLSGSDDIVGLVGLREGARTFALAPTLRALALLAFGLACSRGRWRPHAAPRSLSGYPAQNN